ncbi:MAG: PAS domain-containing protein [bacterium]|nr:PAS domain-containing protein [bacterium]
MAISLRIEDAESSEVAEASLRASLVPISSVGAPAVLFGSLLWSQIDLPGAPAAAATLLAIGYVLFGLALRWHRHPPRRAHLAASTTLAMLFVSAMVQLLVYPNPGLGALHVVLAFGAAVSLTDLRWLVGVELFGAATWLAPFALASAAPQWPLVGLVLFASSIAALAARVGHFLTIQRIRDLTSERESREDAIGRSNRALRNAQRIASVGSYEWDPATNELSWSDEHYRIFGWEPGEPLSSKRFFDAIVAEDRPRLVEALARSLNDGTPVDLEFQIRRPDGQRRLLHGLGVCAVEARSAA